MEFHSFKLLMVDMRGKGKARKATLSMKQPPNAKHILYEDIFIEFSAMATTTDQCYLLDYESQLDRKREIEHELLAHSYQIICDNLYFLIKNQRENQCHKVMEKKQHLLPRSPLSPSPLSSDNSDLGLFGNRIISVVSLLNSLERLVCSTCLEKIVFAEEKLVGQASTLYFLCGFDSRLALQSSDLCTTSKHFQVKDRLQVSMYEIGCDYEVARNFCGNMDLPPPVSCKSWNQIKIKIHEAFEAESSKSKNKAASEIKDAKGNDVTVSCDGTWQKRGLSSKNGVVTVATVNGISSKSLIQRP
eukprot:gene3930-15256_t